MAKTKTTKATAKPKKAGKSPTSRVGISHNLVDPEVRKVFLVHNDSVTKLKAAVASATGKLRAAYKAAKGDGFTKRQFDVAALMASPEGEVEYRAKVAADLRAAQYMGADIGAQLHLFEAPSAVPIADRAYQEGQKASMENKPAKPDYAPSTDAYAAYMKGYQEHQETLARGIKPTEPKPAKATTKPPKEDAPATAPAVPLTRDDIRKRQAAQGGSMFEKETVN